MRTRFLKGIVLCGILICLGFVGGLAEGSNQVHGDAAPDNGTGGGAADGANLYFAEGFPGLEPELFAPERLTASSLGGTFSPDMTEFYCTWQDQPGMGSRIVGFKRTEEGWEGIIRLMQVSSSIALEPHVSPDGTLFFYTAPDYTGQWGGQVSEKSGEWWRRSKSLPSQINDPEWLPMYITSTLDGTLYFTQVSTTADRIVRVPRTDDGYGSVEVLPDTINGSGHVSHPYIAPDESFLIFDSSMGSDSTGFDLYISFRTSDGWTEPANIAEVNTTGQEICASMSPDGRVLLFTRDARIYWVDASILDRYRP